jgi:hypothetical protein
MGLSHCPLCLGLAVLCCVRSLAHLQLVAQLVRLPGAERLVSA